MKLYSFFHCSNCLSKKVKHKRINIQILYTILAKITKTAERIDIFSVIL